MFLIERSGLLGKNKFIKHLAYTKICYILVDKRIPFYDMKFDFINKGKEKLVIESPKRSFHTLKYINYRRINNIRPTKLEKIHGKFALTSKQWKQEIN